MMSGLVGVPLGSYLAQRFRLISQKCDPLICAGGLFISAPMVFLSLALAAVNTSWCFFFVFVAELSLNMCWSIVADILLVSNNMLNATINNTKFSQIQNYRWPHSFDIIYFFLLR